ncbi:uncharacterized protein H6S33_010447 [Morchella sextelata]|uniref:uncharacterized protein n=1 Tax=Morchella sextelata TaxID=1174677 RepID=UPI001D04FE45|nr:uncharacterized protein H6S33_010447 [Morchella sextelata]KAH0612395.1 hypothetical protein H6S33_010447 [Morchella sextelata]
MYKLTPTKGMSKGHEATGGYHLINIHPNPLQTKIDSMTADPVWWLCLQQDPPSPHRPDLKSNSGHFPDGKGSVVQDL